MAPLGPFEDRPRLAVAVSGGADSLSLALLADAWARQRGGSMLALVVDHGLRAESAAEARLTLGRLAGRGIPGRLLTLSGLMHGPALAERARAARHAVLEAACAEAGIVHLLYGHHACDQAETVAMRLLAHSGPAGLAGMAALSESATVRRLRPLLAVPPLRLRATLRAAGMEWVEDPSNRDPATLRARLRALRRDPDGTGPATEAAVRAAAARGNARAAAERGAAELLARGARLYPEGFAVLGPGLLPTAPLAALLRVLAGAEWPPSEKQLARLAEAPAAATIGGVRILPAGRLQPGGWLLVREEAAMAAGVPAVPGAVWDGRFRLCTDAVLPEGARLEALGAESARLRRHSHWPAAVLRALPAVRVQGSLFAVPHIGYAGEDRGERVRISFICRMPASGAGFLAGGVGASQTGARAELGRADP